MSGESGFIPLGEAKRRAAAGAGNPALPTIRVIGGEMPRVVDEAEAALLASDHGLFQRAAMIVRPYIERVPAAGGGTTFSHRMARVTEPHLREVMTRAANFEKYDGRAEDFLAVNCPKEIAETYAAREGQWKLRVLARVINCPTIRRDGSILDKPGYDEDTALLFDPCGQRFPAIARNPKREDALAALRCLKELLSSYPFVDRASGAVALAGLFTALARPTLATAPLFGVTSPVPGSGKSHYVDLVSIIALGQPASVIAQARSTDETEKRLASALIAGDAIVSLDNCDQPVGGGQLCIAVTQPMMKVRVLGVSENAEIPSNTAFFATGNNLAIGDDMSRRVLICSLDPQLERPELREFGTDPHALARRERGRYVAAVLTCLRAYHVAGRPSGPLPLASFSDWSLTVRNALMWLGEADPCETMEVARAADAKLRALVTVMDQWETIPTLLDRRKTVSELVSVANEEEALVGGGGIKYRHPDFRDAIVAVAGEGSAGIINNRRLGKWLLANQRRVCGGRRIVQDGVRGGVALWKLELAESP